MPQRGFKLLTRELWVQNDQRCNRGRAQPRMGCSPLSYTCFPEQVHTPSRDTALQDGCPEVLPAIRGFPQTQGLGGCWCQQDEGRSMSSGDGDLKGLEQSEHPPLT